MSLEKSIMPPLDLLPRELLRHICSFLTPHDHAQLATASKSFGALAEALIWANIDLHTHGRDYEKDLKVSKLIWMLDHLARNDAERAKQIASRARSLRFVIRRLDNPRMLEYTWNIFPLFSNLEKLDLSSRWDPYLDGGGWAVDESLPPLPALRSAKLFGYLPATFVQYIVRSAPTLEWLELGVLDEPIDWDQGADSNSDPADEDSLNAEEVAPRPLPLFPSDKEMPVFTRLRHLHLCKPSMCDPEHYGIYGGVSYSSRAEEASLSDWKRLLTAVQGTVETLILEHRVVAEYIENDGLSEREFIEDSSAGPAEDHFMERIVPVLDENAFPKLQSVHMVGILVREQAIGRRSRLKKLFENSGVQWKFMYGHWCFFDGTTGLTYWAPFPYHFDEGGDEEVED